MVPLTRKGLSPAEVIEGYELAAKKALDLLPELVCYTSKNVYDKDVSACVWPVIV